MDGRVGFEPVNRRHARVITSRSTSPVLVLSPLDGRHVEFRGMQHEGTIVIPTAGGATTQECRTW